MNTYFRSLYVVLFLITRRLNLPHYPQIVRIFYNIINHCLHLNIQSIYINALLLTIIFYRIEINSTTYILFYGFVANFEKTPGNLKTRKLENLKTWKLENLKTRKLENLKPWKLKTLKTWKVENLKPWELWLPGKRCKGNKYLSFSQGSQLCSNLLISRPPPSYNRQSYTFLVEANI